jgi:hypothetical protein
MEPERFVVQRILRRRLLAGGAPEYHTLWEGYAAAEATWEPAESFAGCRWLLATFERGLERQPAGVENVEPTARRPRNEPDDAGWAQMFERLVVYKAAQGDCRVPQGWAEDPALANWVMTQRNCKRKLDRGEPRPGMTAEKVARLTALVFAWTSGQTDAPGARIGPSVDRGGGAADERACSRRAGRGRRRSRASKVPLSRRQQLPICATMLSVGDTVEVEFMVDGRE